MKHRLSVMAVVVTALVAFLGRETALTAPAENRSYVRPSLPGADGPPFSGAVKVGNTLYLSGDIGLTEDQKVPGDAKA
jgi:enamine deaminase RidA (YjgF/YER057c/UK114 family)